ncbi:MAG: CinA family protein [Acholeplasmataceae bacterium]
MIAKNVCKKLMNNGLTIAFSESMSGGSLAFEMIKNEGASKVILGSLIVYSNQMKHKLLGIPLETLKTHGTVSQAIVTEMVYQTKYIFNSDVTVAITGNAGFSFEPKSDERMAFIAILFKDKLHIETIHFDNLSRLKAIRKTTQFTYQMIERLLG